MYFMDYFMNYIEDGKLSNEDIAKYSDLPLRKIKELAEEICVSVK